MILLVRSITPAVTAANQVKLLMFESSHQFVLVVIQTSIGFPATLNPASLQIGSGPFWPSLPRSGVERPSGVGLPMCSSHHGQASQSTLVGVRRQDGTKGHAATAAEQAALTDAEPSLGANSRRLALTCRRMKSCTKAGWAPRLGTLARRQLS